MSTARLSEEQQEIVALLESELIELQELAASVFASTDEADAKESNIDEHTQTDALDTFATTLTHIGSAVELAGLMGLADTCRVLSENFSQLATAPPHFSDDLTRLLKHWPAHLLRYLQEMHDPQQSVDHAQTLVVMLGQPHWPYPLAVTQQQDLLSRFQASHFSLIDDDADAIPEIATAAMVSLEAGEDARAELIDGMLIELPRQAQEFEASVNRFLSSNNLDDLTQARRMAHTLKGSANIVGIQAIANLMHHSEDILEIIAKRSIERSAELEDLLLNVSDTLSMITEYLTGIGPAPENTIEVLQDVLDFARDLKGEGNTPPLAESELEPTSVANELTTAEEPTIKLKESEYVEAFDIDDFAVEEILETASVDESELELADFMLDDTTDLEGELSEDLLFANDEAEDVLDAALLDENLFDEDLLDESLLAPNLLPEKNEYSDKPAYFDNLEFGQPASASAIHAEEIATKTSEELVLGSTQLSGQQELQDKPTLGKYFAETVSAETVSEPETAEENIHTEVDSSLAAFSTESTEQKEIPLPPIAAQTSKTDVKDSSAGVKDSSAPSDETPEEETEDNYRLSVPLSTAQELLRIAGETQITNAQIEAQISAMRVNVKATEQYQLRLRNMANELESLVQTQNALRAASMKYSESEIDPIEMERYSELDTFSNQLIELSTDAHEAISHVEEQLRELSGISYTQQQLNKDNQGTLLRLRMIPVEVMSSRFARCVRQAARLSRKSVDFHLEGGNLLVDSMVLNRIVDPLLHLLRNAVDHGIESDVEQRTASGKILTGHVTLRFEQRGEILTITCQDDGRGLDYEKIREKAEANGIISGAEDINQKGLEQLIFLPGFSTRGAATQTSGRGIGLDAVVSDVKGLKGAISISSESQQGCAFVITVPTSILTGHALLVRCTSRIEQQILSVVSRNIEQIVYIAQDQILRTETGLAIEYDGESVPLVNINELVNLFTDFNDTISAVLITRRPNGQRIGVGVEAVLASQDMVVKPLNRYVYHPPGIVGATILGDGAVSPVIDLQELPGISMMKDEWERWRTQLVEANRKRDQSKADMPLALIVDDSLSARRSLAQFVTDMGMEALTAKDGFEAINVISERKPSILLVDLEMPRMNGLELTSHLRSRADTRDIPIIMITSRTTEKHRTMAESAGVNTYLNKPWSEEELLECIEKELLVH